MHWIALQWQPEDLACASTAPGRSVAGPDAEAALPSAEALGWWALQFTPRVVWVDEALLLEVSTCERLWGGRLGLMREIVRLDPAGPARLWLAEGATSLIALARLRMLARDEKPPDRLPADLPLDTLSAARDRLDLLGHLGCRTWGDVAALPRGGLTRRFGKSLREALDAAYGLCPEGHRWLTLPEVFEQKLELPALAESAPELMWSANRLLTSLQIWLRSRQRGVLAFELQWTLDLKRFDGVDLPPHQQIEVRTAEPTEDMTHLRRLLSERLALTRLAAPASWLRLRTLRTAPRAGASTSFLPEDNRKGDKLHELVERLSARLGAQQVLSAVARADHRPEHQQSWRPALQAPAGLRDARHEPGGMSTAQALCPSWLLREPLPLDMQGEHPCYQGPLRKLVGPQRLEAGWWNDGQPAVRDYYIAESPGAGLVWIYRERPSASQAANAVRWYLQGIYA